jgi:hypothetical protein
MKELLCICIIATTACGYSSSGNELEGQVKKVIRRTPIICPDYYEADVSLGVLRNGVGSLSKEDVTLYVERPDSVETLKAAARTGAIVSVRYDVKRVTLCVPEHFLTSVFVEGAAGNGGGGEIKP